MEEEVQDGEVPHSYFPMRSGCRVTMYNDAHQVSSLSHSQCRGTIFFILHGTQPVQP